MQLFEVSYIVVMFNTYKEYSPNSPFVACNDINHVEISLNRFHIKINQYTYFRHPKHIPDENIYFSFQLIIH